MRCEISFDMKLVLNYTSITLFLYINEFIEYNNKTDIEVKIEIIKIYKIN